MGTLKTLEKILPHIPSEATDDLSLEPMIRIPLWKNLI